MGRLVLVTGGAGYVGAIVVEELMAHGFKVRVLDALLHGNSASVESFRGRPEYSFVQSDVRDQAARLEALDAVWGVVHLAAIVGDPACARQPDLAREVNLDATRGLLEDADSAGVERLVFASTCSNYGRIDGAALANEEFPLNPVSLYAETKVAAELAVLAHSAQRLATTCVRLATVFGVSKRMRFDLTVNEFTRDVVLANDLVVYGEQFWRPYVHVRDAARGIRLVLEAPSARVAGQVFNVGSTDENYRKLDLVRLLKERFPEMQVQFVRRDEDPRDYRVSFEKVREALDFEVETPVPDGIDEVSELLRSGTVPDPYDETYRN
jgi:nucleoside-diphosphate-sugar epimerase